MKVINLHDEAKRLNVSYEFLNQTILRALRARKIFGVMIPENAELIQFKSEEVDSLIAKLNSTKVSPKTLQTDLNLTANQVYFLLNYLIRENKLKANLTENGQFSFFPDLKESVLKIIEEKYNVKISDISTKLFISEIEVERIIEEVTFQILTTIKPYAQIRVSDLATEIGSSKEALLPLLKRIILERKIPARIDMINETLVIDEDKSSLNTSNFANRYEDKEKGFESPKHEREMHVSTSYSVSKPSSGWYLVPLLFGLIGGILGYVAVKDADSGMAENLIGIGVLITILEVIYLWLNYSLLF